MICEWTECRCSHHGYYFSWSKPHLDGKKGVYRCIFRQFDPTHGASLGKQYQRELSIKESEFSEARFRMQIICEVEYAIQTIENVKNGFLRLGEYLSGEGKWEEIRVFFGWSTNTVAAYRNLLHNVFQPILMLPKEKITTTDIDQAIEQKCADHKYKASTIRSWYKVINRIFVYLQAAFPGFYNPVRMNGRKIREARLDQKKITAERRISQTTLTDDQARTVLFTFLRDMKQGNLLGVIGITMLQSGHRPIEAGATTLGMHCLPDGESFLSAWVYEVVHGNIVDNHKSHRSRRLIPDGPVLETVYHYVLQRMLETISTCNSNLDWREVPFGGQPIIKNGQLVEVKPFSSKEVSCYVRRILEENGITFRVEVDRPEEDSDDNRRAYILRYTAATNLSCFLRRDLYQYVMAHRRSTSANIPEDNKENTAYYSSPQTQRIIYQGLKARDEAVYGPQIVDEIKCFLGFDDFSK